MVRWSAARPNIHVALNGPGQLDRILAACSMRTRALGVHFGAALPVVERLRLFAVATIGIERLTLDPRGLSDEPGSGAALRALVEAACRLGMRVLAQGFVDTEALARAWAPGFDTAVAHALERPPTC